MVVWRWKDGGLKVEGWWFGGGGMVVWRWKDDGLGWFGGGRMMVWRWKDSGCLGKNKIKSSKELSIEILVISQ